MRVYAHRGSHEAATENTHAAFAQAIEEGADGVELDVRPCASGEVVVVHDRDLERVAGDLVEVARAPLARLRRVDLGDGERVPLLDDVIDQVLGAGLELNVEVKGDVPNRRASALAVAALLSRRSAAERDSIVLSTFDPLVLFVLRMRAQGVRSAFLFDEAHTGKVRAAILTRSLAPHGVHPHHPLCTVEAVALWKRRGLFVNAWTVDDPVEAQRLASLGVDVAITDRVPLLQTALRGGV